MSLSLSDNRSAWAEVTRQVPCKVCGRGDYCRASTDGAFLCRRGPFNGSTEKTDRNGSTFWVGFPGGVTPAPAFEQEAGPTPAPAAQLDRAYRELLSHLTLSPDHRRQMVARGFTDHQAEELGVKSLEMAGRQVAQRLAELFPFWLSVPGLYLSEKGRPVVGGWSGLLIPCRDLQGRIIALRIRADSSEAPRYSWLSSERHGGPGPGSPLSWWPGNGGSDAIRVCEGELKSAFAALTTGVSTVCAPGVGLFGGSQVMDWILDLGAARVILCPDADFRTNPHVSRAVGTAVTRLLTIPYPITLETWDPRSKGIDDALQAGRPIRSIQPEEFFSIVKAQESTKPSEGSPSNGKPVLPLVATVEEGWPKPDPFEVRDERLVTAPMWALPETFGGLIESVAAAKQVTTDSVLASMLGLLSAVCAGRYCTKTLAPQYTSHAHVWILLALGTSGGKSESLQVLQPAIYRAQKRLQAKAQERNDGHAQERAGLSKHVLAMEMGSAEDYPGQLFETRRKLREVRERPLPRFLWKDVSPVQMDVLYAKHQRVGIVSPESADWISLIMGYGKDAGPSLGSCLSGFSVEPHGSDRITRDESHAERPVLSLFLACQEKDMKEFICNPVARRRGFLGRCLVIRGRSLVGGRLAPDKRPVIRESDLIPWVSLVDTVADQVPTSDDDGWIPLEVSATPEACKLFSRIFETVEKRLSEDTPDLRLNELEDVAARCMEQVGRLSLLLHVLWTAPRHVLPTAESISEATVFRAFGLMLWALQGFMELSSSSPAGGHGQALELWQAMDESPLLAKGFTTLREWHDGGPGRWRSLEKVKPQLKILEGLGYIQMSTRKNPRGPSSQIVELNPLARSIPPRISARVASVCENPLFIEVITRQPHLPGFARVARVCPSDSIPGHTEANPGKLPCPGIMPYPSVFCHTEATEAAHVAPQASASRFPTYNAPEFVEVPDMF